MTELRDTLSSFLPRVLADHVESGTTPTPPAVAHIEGAALVCDISGFTRLAEELAEQGPAGAELLGAALNESFGRLIDVIVEHGGDVLTFAGDAMLAFWETSDQLDLSGAVQRGRIAGARMQQANEEFGPDGGTPLSLRISIGAGQASRTFAGDAAGPLTVLTLGPAIEQALNANADAPPGGVALSAEAVELADAAPPPDTGPPDAAAIVDRPAVAPPASPPASPSVSDGTVEGFRPFVSHPVWTRLEAGQDQWLAELRRVTVLFILLPGLDDETAASDVQRVVEVVQRELGASEATINKFNVDEKGVSVVAALGLPPLAHEDDAARGARAALDVRAALEGIGWDAAIGVATGRAFCGAVGNARRREYTMIGDVVNLSARLMQAAHRNTDVQRILCDEATATGAGEAVGFEPLEAIRVKGKAEAIRVFAPGEPETAEVAPRSDVVGRAEEAGVIRALFTDVLAASTRVVVVEGEAGIGKSTLLHPVRESARGEGLEIWAGGGDPLGRGAPYHGWRPIFRALGEAGGGAARLVKDLGDEFSGLEPLLGTVLGKPLPETPESSALSPEDRLARTRDLLLRVLARSATDSATLIVLEDGHWLDSASLHLALDVARRLPSLLLLVTSRPFGAGSPPELVGLTTLQNATHLVLEGLSPTDSERLVCQCLGATSLSRRLSALIAEKGGGNPLFIEQLAYSLHDTGVIRVEDGRGFVPRHVDLGAVEFPDTVQGVITGRLDRLAPGGQLALKVASVIGTEFEQAMLEDLYPVSSGQEPLSAALAGLVAANLLQRRPDAGADCYGFSHAITRDVAYGLMLFDQRRGVHRAAAEWFERTHADDLPPHFPTLAYHWSKAEDGEKAIPYLELAAKQALSEGMSREASHRGLDAAGMLGVELPRDPAEIEPSLGALMGEIAELMAGRRPSDLMALPAAEDEAVIRATGIILDSQPAAAMSQQQMLFAIMALQNFALTLRHGSSHFSPGVYAVYASVVRAMTGDSAGAHEINRVALELADRAGGEFTPFVGFVHTWLINFWVEPLATNFELARRCADLAFERDDILYGAFNASALPTYLTSAGVPLERVVEAAEDGAARIADRVHSSAFHCRHERQFARALMGRTTDALGFTDDVYDEEKDVASVLESEAPNQIGYFLTSKVQLHYYYRQFEQAAEIARQTLPLLPAFEGQAREPDFVFFHTLSLLGLAQEREEDDRTALLGQAEEGLGKLERWASVCEANFGHKLGIARAEAARAEGRLSDALAMLDRAAESAENHGYLQHAALGHERAADAALDTGDRERAGRSLDASRDLWSRLGATRKVEDLSTAYPEL
ncbi:MAG: AAA family ATPase [Gemmatimonadota bacterium]